jgi:signal transduction histidine kinase
LKNQSAIVKNPETIITDKSSILQAFFNSVPQYQILLNTKLEIIAFNDYALKLNRKYALSDLQAGKNILSYIDTSLVEDFKIQCETALKGDCVQYEHFIEGGWFDFVINALYNSDDEIIGLSIVGSNVNDQKRNAKIIRQQSEYLSNIAWFQSHQLRHPVSSVLALLNLIKEEEDYHLTKEYLQALEVVTKQLDAIINAIVKQSREI